MNLALLGGDKRMVYAAEYLHNNGYKTFRLGLDAEGTEIPLCECINSVDAVILPLPFSSDNVTLRTPLSKSIIYLEDIVLCQPKNIFGGMLSAKFRERLQAANIPYFDYYESEALTVKNAMLTAEAAISIAVAKTDFSIFGSKSLIIGYGRIGKLLAKYLKSLGSETTATSRADGTLAVIETDGLNAINTSDILSLAHNFDFVFNTVPAPIIDRKFFSTLKKNCYVADLATGAGSDFNAATEYHINAEILPGLPGKFFPKTAGELIGQEIINHLKR